MRKTSREGKPVAQRPKCRAPAELTIIRGVVGFLGGFPRGAHLCSQTGRLSLQRFDLLLLIDHHAIQVLHRPLQMREEFFQIGQALGESRKDVGLIVSIAHVVCVGLGAKRRR